MNENKDKPLHTEETTTDEQETESGTDAEDDSEEDEQFNPFAAPELPPEASSEYLAHPLDLVIIPKIIEHRFIDDYPEVKAILEEEGEENEEEKHQHFFLDQITGDRPRWNNHWFHVAAMIAFMVGTSNLTAFPNNAAKFGGIAYIIAYGVVLALFVYPMVYLEAMLGQYFRTGMVGIWGLTPISQGLGASFIYISFLILTFASPRTLHAVIFMVEALVSVKTGILPWSGCDNEWNTCHCIGTRNILCLEWKKNMNTTGDQYSPAQEYFIGRVLQMWKTKYTDPLVIEEITEAGNWSTSYGFNNEREGLGPMISSFALMHIGIYALIMAMALSNMNAIGYFLLFTTSCPLAVLLLLFCRAVTLHGAFQGLMKYLATTTNFLVLLDGNVWYVAFTHAFYSTTAGAGSFISMASFSPLQNNVKRDVVISIAVDTLIGLLATVVVYMLIGHLYYSRHEPLPDIFPGDDNLIFSTLADCFLTVSGSGFFAFMFYFMVVTFCVDTQVVVAHSLCYSLYEEFKRKYPDMNPSRLLFLFTACGFAITITLVCTTRGGHWLSTFFSTYLFGLSTFHLSFTESIVLPWIWGMEEICSAIETIDGNRPSMFLRIMWKYGLPICLSGKLIYSNAIKDHKPIEVFGQTAPSFSVDLGFELQWIAISLVLLYGIFTYLRMRKKGKTCLEVVMMLISPEYEHDEILADVRSAKRLKWSHYAFIMYSDEKWDCDIRARFTRALQKLKDISNSLKCGRKEKAVEAVAAVGKEKTKEERKEERKKKKEQKKQALEEKKSAWDLWNEMNKDKDGKVEDQESRKEEEDQSVKKTRARSARMSKLIPSSSAANQKGKKSKMSSKVNTSSSNTSSSSVFIGSDFNEVKRGTLRKKGKRDSKVGPAKSGITRNRTTRGDS